MPNNVLVDFFLVESYTQTAVSQLSLSQDDTPLPQTRCHYHTSWTYSQDSKWNSAVV